MLQNHLSCYQIALQCSPKKAKSQLNFHSLMGRYKSEFAVKSMGFRSVLVRRQLCQNTSLFLRLIKREHHHFGTNPLTSPLTPSANSFDQAALISATR